MLSGWHVHARGYANELMKMDGVNVAYIWDEDGERGRKWASEIGAEFVAELDFLLQKDDLDGVVVDTPTNMHPEVIIKAARAGKHIFTEKVLALTMKDAKKIEKEVREAGVKFCISLPHRCRPDILFAHQVVEKGLLGDITLMRVRNAHDGSISDWLPDHFYDPEECGGGAMVDLGAHGMYLANWFMGEPKKVTSMFTNVTPRQVEDNAVSVIEFSGGAIAINETGFVSKNDPFSLELNGTKGSLVLGGPFGKIAYNSVESETAGWVIPTSLPQGLPSPLKQWVEGITSNGRIHFGLEEALGLTQIMEAAYQSIV